MEDAGQGECCFVSIDATDCPILEPGPFSPQWYSHKLNGAGLKYEVALNIRTGDIVWVNGGLPCGSYSDLKLAREEFVPSLAVGEKALADRTYQDHHFINSRMYPETAAIQKKILARHETVNSRLKSFNVLKYEFRHNLLFHPQCFRAVANLVQLSIENGEPLFQLF